MTVEIEVTTTPRDLFQRMERYPSELDAQMNRTMEQVGLHLVKSVPPYPPPPEGSTYVRTVVLGKSLTKGGGGNVWNNQKLGQGNYEFTFGTNIEYGPFVIGDDTQARHMGHWWRMSTVAKKAQPGIVRLFDAMANRIAGWLEGRR